MSYTDIDVRVYPITEPKGSTEAFASVTVDNLIAICGVRIVNGEKGLFVAMPQYQDNKTKEYKDIAFPLTADLRRDINDAALDEYERVLELPPGKRGYDSQNIDAAAKDKRDFKVGVRVYPLDKPTGNIKAFAGVSVNDIVAIRGVRVLEGGNGPFVAMPQFKDRKTEEYRDLAFPINGDLRKEINKAVLTEYAKLTKNADKSLAEGLKKGAEKAAQADSKPRERAANRRSAMALG